MHKTAADSNTENVEDRQHDLEWSLRDSVHLEPFFCFVVLCSNCKGIFSLKMKCQHCCGACHSHLLWGSWEFWLCDRFLTEAITGRLIKQPDQLWLELKWIKASSWCNIVPFKTKYLCETGCIFPSAISDINTLLLEGKNERALHFQKKPQHVFSLRIYQKQNRAIPWYNQSY